MLPSLCRFLKGADTHSLHSTSLSVELVTGQGLWLPLLVQTLNTRFDLFHHMDTVILPLVCPRS